MTSNKYNFFIFLILLSFQSYFYSAEVDEIVVSGDWREISETEKNSSLIIFTEENIEKKQYKHFEDLSYSVPNLNFAASDSRSGVACRKI